MIQEPIETRLTRLEELVARLIRGRADDGTPTRDDWIQTVGMFRGDPVVQEMIDESQRSREEERRQAGDEAERDST
jgi:hypothetical protein